MVNSDDKNPGMKLFSLLFIGACLIIAFVIWLFYKPLLPLGGSSDLTELIEPAKRITATETVILENEEIGKETNHEAAKAQTWSPMGDEASKAKIMSWFSARGNYSFYGPDEKRDIQNYDLETLKKLSDSGDIRAMHELANRAETIEGANSILYRAAIFGSTAAISQIGSSIESWQNIDQLPDDQRNAFIVEALAHYEAATLRGDWWGSINDGGSLKRRYSYQPDEHDMARIRNRAKEIYDELQRQRTDLGLGDFDNTVPDEVMKFYEEMLRPL
ncbi:hypothetical protein D0C16_15015 [Cellvibrio sp. KY-GH-1]|uniref:hypothetical protein n=1 Tax=Cellvibrio sp. KY-GH-1 TaxID=2303332 RepID=UPI001243CDF1|nr:hypothetical protein [Cellvibrio sp. KY-GH-1]QEY17173.1 hypothetical protein D0C16_15015 [Cellvibrio sp. KY-GH-1]